MVHSNQSQYRDYSIKLESKQEWLNQIRVKTGTVQSNQSQYRNCSIKSESKQEYFNQIRVNMGTVQSNQCQYRNGLIKLESIQERFNQIGVNTWTVQSNQSQCRENVQSNQSQLRCFPGFLKELFKSNQDQARNQNAIFVFGGHGCKPTIFPFHRPHFVLYCKFCAHVKTQHIACMSPLWQAGYSLLLITFIIWQLHFTV